MTEAAYRIKTKQEKEHNSSITTDIELWRGNVVEIELPGWGGLHRRYVFEKKS